MPKLNQFLLNVFIRPVIVACVTLTYTWADLNASQDYHNRQIPSVDGYGDKQFVPQPELPPTERHIKKLVYTDRRGLEYYQLGQRKRFHDEAREFCENHGLNLPTKDQFDFLEIELNQDRDLHTSWIVGLGRRWELWSDTYGGIGRYYRFSNSGTIKRMSLRPLQVRCVGPYVDTPDPEPLPLAIRAHKIVFTDRDGLKYYEFDSKAREFNEAVALCRANGLRLPISQELESLYKELRRSVSRQKIWLNGKKYIEIWSSSLRPSQGSAIALYTNNGISDTRGGSVEMFEADNRDNEGATLGVRCVGDNDPTP